MSTLYRDYRPKSFSEVLGQNHIKLALQNEIASGKLSHSYLFCGPRAVGKTTLARIVAKAANCRNRKDGEYEPCGKCESCTAILDGKNLDVIEIDAASNTGVDNVRENVISFSRLVPSGNKFKVFIIDEVHMLSIQAFNALLKIMEEPPKYVIFILCTTEAHKVPGTIVSRCERFDFKRISVPEITQKLTRIASEEKIEIDASVLEAVARQSGGHLRDAEGILGQIFSIGGKKISREQAELVMPGHNSDEALKLIEAISKKDAAKAIIIINGLIDRGVSVKNFNNEIISILRRMMLDKLNPGLSDSLGLDLGENLEKDLASLTEGMDIRRISIIVKKFLETALAGANSPIPQLPLEIAVAELCFENTYERQVAVIPPPNEKNGVAPENVFHKNKIEDGVSENKSNVPPINTTLSISNEINASCNDVSASWPEFLFKIKKCNHSLSFVLQNCNPGEIKNGILKLSFKYKFHCDRLKDAATKGTVSSVLSEVYGGNIGIEALVDENVEIKPIESKVVDDKKPEIDVQSTEDTKPGGMLSNLLSAFGGEIIS